MNYKYESIMSWIMYIRAGIWNIDNKNEFLNNPDVIKDKFEKLFQIELLREFNDVRHSIFGIDKLLGTVTSFYSEGKFVTADNYNNLLAFYNGIYKEYDGKKLCLNTKRHGLKNEYFLFLEEEVEPYVSVRSVIEGTCKNSSLNVKRLISILFSRQFEYLESLNPEDSMFLDYTAEEKEQMIKDCIAYDKWLNQKKEKKEVYNGEE